MLLNKLILRGDQVAIVDGRVQILPASGKHVSSAWLKGHSQILCEQIANVTKLNLHQYVDYSTGWVKGHSIGFVSLKFADITSGISVHLTWNANTKYTRSTRTHKQGDRLPDGKFLPNAGSKFIRFWHEAKQVKPSKPSAYAEKMHLLKELLFIGEAQPYKNGFKFKDKTIHLADISNNTIVAAINSSRTDNSSLNARQQLAKPSLTARQAVAKDGRQGISTSPYAVRVTDDFNCVSPEVRKESKDKRVTIEEGNVIPINQSTEEWLESYGDR